MRNKVVTCLFLFIAFTGVLYSQTSMRAEIDKNIYAVNEIITVKINVEENDGFHGLYFDLDFDGTVFAFEGMEEGLLTQRTGFEGEFYYAFTDSSINSIGDRVVVSYALKNSLAVTYETGTLAEIRFRVIRQPPVEDLFRFRFRDTGMQDECGNEITDVTWTNTRRFSIGSSSVNSFIHITRPYDNEVFYTDEIEVDVSSTADPSMGIVLVNGENDYSAEFDAAEGGITGAEIPVVYGFNKITASLLDENGIVTAVDSVTIVRSPDDQFIKIVSPKDHALVVSNMIHVRASTSFDNVKINGMEATDTGETAEGHSVFEHAVWLKEGFNTITGVTESTEDIIYKDTIVVYYEKNNAVFRFIEPVSGYIFKTNDNAGLSIKGEISSLYNSKETLNNVTLSVIYRPLNPFYPAQMLVNNEPAVLEESEIISNENPPYIFYNDFPINISGLSSGEIEIIAYKNRQGNKWENEIHRIVFVDNSRLYIDLAQPNIFTHDILDTEDKINDFHDSENPPDYSTIGINLDGSIMLKEEQSGKIEPGVWFTDRPVTELIELSDGSLAALVNDRNNVMRIFKKEHGASSWEPVLSSANKYGYTICETDLGILVGVSNLLSSDDSGLYLIRGDSLTNIAINEPIANVQFVKNNNGIIYLYGNDYSHIYSFNIFSLQEDKNGRLSPLVVERTAFNNNLFIEQFVLSEDGTTALIRTRGNRVYMYQNLNGSEFIQAYIPEPYNSSMQYVHIVNGTYEDGSYNVYIFLEASNKDIVTVMEDKKTHRLIVNRIELGLHSNENLLGFGFHNEHFIIITHEAGNPYIVKKGQILFNHILWRDAGFEYEENGISVDNGSIHILETMDNAIYFGFGNESASEVNLYSLSRNYNETGYLTFDYKNNDIDGITGFSFEIDTVWAESDSVRFGFSLNNTDISIPGSTPVNEFLDIGDAHELYSIDHHYDLVKGKEIVHVEFTNLQEEGYLTFEIGMDLTGNLSPSLYNLTVYKKVPVKIPGESGDIMTLPIHGWIYDPTVEEVRINEESCFLEKDGSFSFNYRISSSEDSATISIWCQNIMGETANLNFDVKIFDSENEISITGIDDYEGIPQVINPDNRLEVNGETLSLSGEYYGLIGAILGYELCPYVSDDEMETAEPVVQGIFNKEVAVLDPSLNPGPAYESGTFTDQEITLIPGRQKLVIYVQNPGGLRNEVVFKDIYYNLPLSERKIIITNIDLTDLEPGDIHYIGDPSDGILVDKRLTIDVHETDSEPYIFTGNFTVYGKVQSIDKLYNLKIESYDTSVLFENGEQEIIVNVDDDNTFEVTLVIVPGEESGEIVESDIGFIPTIPYLQSMKTGLNLMLEKSFADTYIVPGFSLMLPGEWTGDEKIALEKPLLIKFDRYVPVGARIDLIVNYETEISGKLTEINPGENIYKVTEGINDLTLHGVKYGINRVRWNLKTKNDELISSSTSQRLGMTDFVFELEGDAEYTDIEIDFPIELQVYYDDISLPVVSIIKDPHTLVRIRLNETVVWEEEGAVTNYGCSLVPVPPVEGINYVSVYYSEKTGKSGLKEYSFLYDTLVPEVDISSYKFDSNIITELTAVINEENLENAILLYGVNQVNIVPVVTYLGGGIYIAEWEGLEMYTPFDPITPRPPSVEYPFMVKVSDHAGNTGESGTFEGLSDVDQPEDDSAVIIDLSPYYYSGNPFFYNDLNTKFPEHVKFFNSSIEIENKQLAEGEEFRVERPGEITLGINTGIDGINSNLTLESGNGMNIMPGFEVIPGGEFDAILNDTILQADSVPFVHNVSSNSISILFWFRYEPEDYYAEDTEYRRILTVYEDADKAVYVAYKDESRAVIGDEYFYLIKEETGAGQQILTGGEDFPVSHNGPDDWNIINTGIDRLSNVFFFAVNSRIPVPAVVESFGAEFDAMLAQDAVYYLGDADPENNGHYSIARLFYINRILSTAEALEIAEISDDIIIPGNEPNRFYRFDSPDDDVDENIYWGLRTEGRHYTSLENSNYEEIATPESPKGSLKATALHENLLTLKNNEIVFKDAPSSYESKVDVYADGDIIRLTPQNSIYPGKYYFANNTGTHGLEYNQYYSISGTVRSINGNSDNPSRIVLKINNNEQSMILEEGDFHFIYENSNTPSSVVLFIETYNTIELSNEIIFTGGNYVLPPEGFSDIDKSYAHTKYIFEPQGTIDFYFKPVNVNDEGFVSYNSILFDSEYIRIGTSGINTPGEGKAEFYAMIKDPETFTSPPAVLLSTNVLVKQGWQHIQLSFYKALDGGDDLLYFYINGELAAQGEGIELPFFGTMAGTMTTGDNIFIGTDVSESIFAEGYIDDVRITNIFKGPVYEDRNPFVFSFENLPEPSLHITEQGSHESITDIHYTLTSVTKRYSETTNPSDLSEHGFDIVNLEPGSYLLKSQMNIGGFRYSNTFNILKDNIPLFSIKDITPLIISGVSTDIFFKLDFDDSYILQSDDAVYAGFGIRITGNTGVTDQEEFSEVMYIIETTDHNGWLMSDDDGLDWQPVSLSENSINVVFKNIMSTVPVKWELKPFYFLNEFVIPANGFDDDDFEEYKEDEIPLASFDVNYIYYTENGVDKEYKLEITIGSESSADGALLYEGLNIGYSITSLNPAFPGIISDIVPPGTGGTLYLYYDDIIADPLPTYGLYTCILTLRYDGETYETKNIVLTREETEDIIIIQDEKYLEIVDFSLLYLDKSNDMAQLYLEYRRDLTELFYNIEVRSAETGSPVTGSGSSNNEVYGDNYIVINNIPVPEGRYIVSIELYGDGLYRDEELTITNRENVPEVAFTNTVPEMIAYNNVLFTWRGYVNGVFLPEIEYSYNFNNQGWSPYKRDWRQIELYNLTDGQHTFRVKARYGNEESVEEIVNFLIDINEPVFDEQNIMITDLYDEDGIRYAVKIEGSVQDMTLELLDINGTSCSFADDGSFTANNVPLEYDGENNIVLSAYDKLGNFSEYVIPVDNSITEIIFPEPADRARYSPLTVTGRLNADFNAGIHIYLKDPLCEDKGITDYSGWKEAFINEDKIFFIEDVFVNPGTEFNTTLTRLELNVVTRSGKVFLKTIDVYANEIIRPIEMELSSHAVDGETGLTEVEITCTANVDTIASWSIDYDGDGVYDDIDVIHNSELAYEHSWTHYYSTLGLITPRARIITEEGNFFSVTGEIIIHERIRSQSAIDIENPLSMDIVRLEDGSDKIYVLAGENSDYRIETYIVDKNDTYLSNKLSAVSINGFGIDNPVIIKAPGRNYIYIASNRNNTGIIHTIEIQDMGSYEVLTECETVFGNEISDFDADADMLYVSFINTGFIAEVPLENFIPQPGEKVTIIPETSYYEPPGVNLHLAKDITGIFISDYDNSRIMHFSHSFHLLNSFGERGTGDGEFLRPVHIMAEGNRIFVYDENRYDIQVFDPAYNLVTTLKYDIQMGDDNYVDSEFFNNIKSLSVVARDEKARLYYYAVIVSESSEKMAMIRLPQWDELRARVRNNKLVFLNDKEIYTAKPDGSDVSRLISTDSLPAVLGTVDYPAISPDGRKIVFTSRVPLYERDPYSDDSSHNQYAYDNLYMIDIDGSNLERISLSAMDDYEIERPQFNSNGDKIIFSAKQPGRIWQIYVYNCKTGGIDQLFSSVEDARFPYYSPDDRFVVYTTNYDGDEEVEIFDTENPSARITVTHNHVRDSFPVWSSVYPGEINNPDLNIESKIAFISERDNHRGIYYTYLAGPSESELHIVYKTGGSPGNDPDAAAILLTPVDEGGSYPCFAGDGESIVYEYFDGYNQGLKRRRIEDHGEIPINIPQGAVKPAGMKNMIVNFDAVPINGNQVSLTWDRYTDNDIRYTVLIREITLEGFEDIDLPVDSQDSHIVKDLEMGVQYLFKISIMENEEEVATTQWKAVEIPVTAAIPSYEIDEDNPYLVYLHAWSPDPAPEWQYSWIIKEKDHEIEVQDSRDFPYEFATSGPKTIILKVTDADNKNATFSEQPLTVEILSDIVPAIEYYIDDNKGDIFLDAHNSAGNRIDWAATKWIVSGPGRDPLPPVTGSNVFLPLDGFLHTINVNLTLKRIEVSGQTTTDYIEKNLIVDIDFKEVKPVITYTPDEVNSRLIRFSGENSLGNINWLGARWYVYADGVELHNESGVSSFAYEFPEMGQDVSYSVTLTAPRRNDNQTETATIIVDIESTPMEPVIDYEILTLETAGSVIGSKLILSCAHSRGNNIDFSLARWTVPIAGNYSEQPTQTGPTAIYNLVNIEEEALIEVSLTLMRRGSTDVETVTKIIAISGNEVPQTELIVHINSEEKPNSTGETLIFDVLSSKGTNIEWEKTEWLLDNTIMLRGPVARLDVPASGEIRIVRYVCTLYVTGTSPIVKDGMIVIEKDTLSPVISYNILSGENENGVELGVLDTPGININWEGTKWFIPDGNENIIEKKGSVVSHAFPIIATTAGYEVVVNMYLTGSSIPFTGSRTIYILGDELKPVIDWDKDENPDNPNENVVLLNAELSEGKNIDWQNCIWTFGDGTPSAYGPATSHEYPQHAEERTYKVSLTISRTAGNGEMETATVTRNITIGAGWISPKIKCIRLPGELDMYEISALSSTGSDIDWGRTTWFIHDGNENVVRYEGAEISHVFPISTQSMAYPVKLQMFLKNSTYPFTKETTIESPKDPLVINITWDIVTDSETGTTVLFNGENTQGSNIDWSACKWTFGDFSPAQYGMKVVHEYPLEDVDRTYTVSLTITRRSTNGRIETVTRYKDIKIDKDELIPNITVYYDEPTGDILLSAEDSEGRGISMSECEWYIGGKDTVADGNFYYGRPSDQTNLGNSSDSSNSNTINSESEPPSSYSISQLNDKKYTTYTGMLLRKHIGNYSSNKKFYITLQIYRNNPDGTRDGKFKTICEIIPKTRNKRCAICTELYDQNLLDKWVFFADVAFGRTIEEKSPHIIKGYHFFARPIVQLMRESKFFTNIVLVFAKPWAEEMAYIGGLSDKGNVAGKLILTIGAPLCGMVGHFLSMDIQVIIIFIIQHMLMILLFKLAMHMLIRKKGKRWIVNQIKGIKSVNGKPLSFYPSVLSIDCKNTATCNLQTKYCKGSNYMKKIFIILLFITISLVSYAQSDARYDSGLNLPFNEKAGDVNPQTGNITLKYTDVELPGRAGMDFTFTRIWSLNQSNVFNMYYHADSNRLNSVTVEQFNNAGTGWSTNIPFIQDDTSSGELVKNLFFGGSVYEIDRTGINFVNINNSNLLGYDLLDKRIYRNSGRSYGDFNTYELSELAVFGVADSELEYSEYVLLLKDNSKYWFRADGKLMMREDSMKDDAGRGLNEIWYFYDSRDRLCLVVDTVGRQIRFGYDADDNLHYIEWDVTHGYKEPGTEIRSEVTETRRVTYNYESGESYPKVLELSGNVIDYEEPFVLKTVKDPYGNMTLLDYKEGPVTFTYNSRKQHTENVYMLLTGITSVYTESDGEYLNKRHFSYGDAPEDLYTKYFYKGYMESYRIHRQYYQDRHGSEMYDTRYIYHDNGEAGNYNQYTTVIKTGGISSTYVYSISGQANKDNVLDMLFIKTDDGFLEYTDFTYNADRIKILETVSRQGDFAYEEEFQYDLEGNLLRHLDRMDLETVIKYDEDYSIPVRIVEKFDNNSYERENDVNDYGQVEREVLYLDKRAVVTASYTYDSYGNVTSVTDADGVTMYTEYDDETHTFPVMVWQNVNIASWPTGDVHDNWLAEPAGLEEVLIRSWKVFNSDGSLWIEVDNEGYAIEHYYDENGIEIETVNPDEDDTTACAEPGADNFTDFRNSIYFDAFLSSRVHNPGVRLEIDYQNEFVRTFADIDKASRHVKVTGIQKDGLGNVEEEIEYGEAGVEYSVKRMSYDSLGRMISLTDPDAGSDYIPVKVDGTYVERYDKTWVVWYDDLGRKTKVLYPTTESGRMHYKYISYNDAENSMTTVDPETRKLYERRDWNNNLVEVIAFGDADTPTAERQTYTYTYDALNRKIAFEDPMGIVTRYEYDERDLLLAQDYGAATGRDEFSYDDVGRLIRKTDRNNNLLTFTYDEMGRNTSVIHYKNGVFDHSVDTVYDNRGNAVRIDNGNLIEHYVYDSNNRVSLLERRLKSEDIRETVSGVWGGNQADQVFTFEYEYNDAGMVTGMTYPDGSLHEFNYDDTLGRLESIWEAPEGSFLQAFVSELEYNRSGVVTRMDYANGTCQEWEFDNRKRISHIAVTKSSGEVIEELDYTLNGVGDILRINENEYEYDGFNRISGALTIIPGNTDLVKLVESHYGTFENEDSVYGLEYNPVADFNTDGRINGYDHLYANTHNGDEVYDEESFTYDKNGNRIKLIQNGDEYTYTYGERNRLLDIRLKKEGEFSSEPYASYEYDANGNTIQRTVYTDEGTEVIYFEYDTLNRLVKTIEDGEETGYFYDNAGNRFIKKLVDGSITLYLRHGQLSVAMDIEVNSDQSEDMGKINRYILSGDLLAGRVTTTVHAAATATIDKSWYHLDHLNSTKCVTDGSEEVEVSYVYRAFGEQLSKLGAGDAKYTYGGKELDDNTNLYYFNARYYDATIGRFINVDPIQDGSNWYVYCNNNPLSIKDPTGLGGDEEGEDGDESPDLDEDPEEEVMTEQEPGNVSTGAELDLPDFSIDGEEEPEPGIEVDFSSTDLNVEITADYTIIDFGYDITPEVDFSNVDFSDFDIGDIEFSVDIDTYISVNVDTNITESRASIDFSVNNIGGSFNFNEGVEFTKPEITLTVEFTIPF